MAGFYAARGWITPPLPWLDLQAPLPGSAVTSAAQTGRTHERSSNRSTSRQKNLELPEPSTHDKAIQRPFEHDLTATFRPSYRIKRAFLDWFFRSVSLQMENVIIELAQQRGYASSILG